MNTDACTTAFTAAVFPPFLLQTLAEVVGQRCNAGESLCRGLGFDLKDLQDPSLRISYRQASSMIQRALQLLPEQGLGLAVGNANVLGTLGILGHALSLSRTLREALQIGQRYHALSGGIVILSLQESAAQSSLQIDCHLADSQVQRFAAEEFCASFMVYMRDLCGPDFKLLGVEFIHPQPSYVTDYVDLFGAHLSFGCSHNRLLLDSAWLDRPLRNHQPLALQQALRLLELEAAQAHQTLDLIQAVERSISRALRTGAHIEQIASELNMSARTLRRRLQEQGLTFDRLLEQIRLARAVSLLANPRMPVQRITEEAGYSDVRSFRRAFRRWTGQSPSDFRR